MLKMKSEQQLYSTESRVHSVTNLSGIWAQYGVLYSQIPFPFFILRHKSATFI